MKELQLIEMMGNVDEALLLRANAPVPLWSKPRFRAAFASALVAALLAITIIASPLAVVITYGSTHPEIKGGLIYVMDAMIKDEDHFLSSLLPKGIKNTLGSVFDALTGGDDEGGNESETEIGGESESESETESRDEMPPASEGLLYERLEFPDQTVYFVVGIGSCTDTTIVIPSTYEGCPVVEISIQAFSDCAQITEVYVSEGIERIGLDAFANCTSLTAIHLPASLKTFDYGYLSKPQGTFFGCPLESITVDPGNKVFVVENGCLIDDSHLSGNYRTVIAACHNATIPIPESYISIYIAPGAFSATAGITQLNFSPMYSLSTNAFAGCPDLTNVTLTGLSAIGFANCTSLQSVTMLKSDSEYAQYNALHVHTKAFENCSALTSLTLPANLTSIESDAFVGCTSLKEITFMGTMADWSKIELYDGWDNGLENCAIRCTDGNIGALVNGNAQDQFTFELNKDSQGYTLTGIVSARSSDIVIPAEYEGLPVTAIGSSAFYAWTDLTSAIVPDSVTVIGSKAFMDCTALKAVTLPAQMQEIGSYAFNGCIALESIVIPEGITEIANYCFEGCSALQEISLPSSLIRIKKYGFSNCDALKEISLPDGMNALGTYAFSSCTNLESVALPDSITSIGTYAFSSCTNLKSIDLPDNMNTISEGTFYFCISLSEVTLHEKIGLISKSAFFSCRSLVHMQFPENLKTIQANAFASCEKLESVYFGAELTKLEEDAFADCKALISITYNGTKEQFREACEVNWISGNYNGRMYTYLAETAETVTE